MILSNHLSKFAISVYVTSNGHQAKESMTSSHTLSGTYAANVFDRLVEHSFISTPFLNAGFASREDGREYVHQIQYGRPNLSDAIASLNPHGYNAVVFACGPHSMTQECADLILKAGIDFKTTEFAL
jgi:hypothetical protein